jgi:hypothetical protein
MPALQPRFVLCANAVHLDKSGLALVLGMTISRPGLDPPAGAIRRIEGRPLQFGDLPKTPGLQFGVSGGVMEGITTAMIVANANGADLLDLNPVGLAGFKDPKRMARLIPELSRFGDRLQVRTLVRLVEPITMTGGEDVGASPEKQLQSRLSKTFEFDLPKIRLSIEIKTEPGQATWRPCAQIDLSLKQQLKMELRQPDFQRRLINIEAVGSAKVVGAARFVDGFEPQDPRIATEEIAKAIAEGWRGGGQMDLMRDAEAPDLSLGTARFRAEDVGWLDPFSVKFYSQAHSKITNTTDAPVEYFVRVPLSDWGGPHVVKPGKSHEFNVPYGLIIRYRTTGGETVRTVPIGAEYRLSASADGGALIPRHVEKTAAVRQ